MLQKQEALTTFGGNVNAVWPKLNSISAFCKKTIMNYFVCHHIDNL